jgi:hypothetical protein
MLSYNRRRHGAEFREHPMNPFAKRAMAAALALVAAIASFAPGARAGAITSRAVGMTLIPRGGPKFTDRNVGAAITKAQQAGADAAQLFNNWSELEPSPGSYQTANLSAPLQVLGGDFGWSLMLTVGVINTVKRETPSDLTGVAWDDPVMIGRFEALFDQIRPLFNSRLTYISIGNEVDVYFLNHPDEFPAYLTFYNDIVDYIHQQAPGLAVGVTTTFTNTMGPAQTMVSELTQNSDVIIFTYYPLQSDFDPEPPDVPLADFPAMVQFAGGRPVILQEVGYPSAHKLKSSPKLQAQFVANVFQAWNNVGAAIPFLIYFGMHDFSARFTKSLVEYYGVNDPTGHFAAYLRSLGLRHVSGARKPGWKAFVRGVADVNGSAAAAGAVN